VIGYPDERCEINFFSSLPAGPARASAIPLSSAVLFRPAQSSSGQRDQVGGNAEVVVGDLGTDAGIDALVTHLDGREIDVLVNNAGFGTYGPFAEIDAGREHELVAVNVDALVRLTHAVLPGMLARGRGGILNVASTIAFQPGTYQATYGASKAFVLSLSQALWAETRGAGVTVTALCPGPTRTGFVDALGSSAIL